MSEMAIRVKDLHKHYPGRDGLVYAVNGLDLDVQSGECFGLLGPNGAGKTTTVEILEGLTRPTSGEVEVLGLRWETSETEIRERIGVTLQETRFPEKATVREMVGLFRSFYREGLDPGDAIARVALEAKSNAFVETLSGGQQRRLAVALALVGDPELIFFDEPTTGLDPQSRRQLWDLIRELQGRGRTILLTTHYMDEAERLCDRVAIVDHGKIIAQGSPAVADLPAWRRARRRVRGHRRQPADRGRDPGRPAHRPARPRRGRRIRLDRRRAASGDSRLAGSAGGRTPSPGPADDPPGEPRRRLRLPHRPPPPRGRRDE